MSTTYAVKVLGTGTVVRTYEVVADSPDAAEAAWRTGRCVDEQTTKWTPTFIDEPVEYFPI